MLKLNWNYKFWSHLGKTSFLRYRLSLIKCAWRNRAESRAWQLASKFLSRVRVSIVNVNITDKSAPHHSVFTGRIPFLSFNQHRRRTKSTLAYLLTYLLPEVIKTMLRKRLSVHRWWCRSMDRQTDRRTDARPLARPRSACYAGNVNSGTLCALLVDYARPVKTRYVTWTYTKSRSYMAAFLDFSVANFATIVLSKFSVLSALTVWRC